MRFAAKEKKGTEEGLLAPLAETRRREEASERVLSASGVKKVFVERASERGRWIRVKTSQRAALRTGPVLLVGRK